MPLSHVILKEILYSAFSLFFPTSLFSLVSNNSFQKSLPLSLSPSSLYIRCYTRDPPRMPYMMQVKEVYISDASNGVWKPGLNGTSAKFEPVIFWSFPDCSHQLCENFLGNFLSINVFICLSDTKGHISHMSFQFLSRRHYWSISRLGPLKTWSGARLNYAIPRACLKNMVEICLRIKYLCCKCFIITFSVCDANLSVYIILRLWQGRELFAPV